MSWLSGWTYRKAVTLSRASGAVTNYQMKILVGESSGATGEEVDCGGLCLPSFNDLRFTAADGTTLLDYWIESLSGATPNQLATIWVEFDSIGTGATTFYMYYGKSDASAVSNGANTFPFFDDFPGNSLDSSKWDVYSNPTVTVANGIVKVQASADSWKSIYTKTAWTAPYALEARLRGSSAQGWAVPVGGVGQYADNGNVSGNYQGSWNFGSANGGTGSWSGAGSYANSAWFRLSHRLSDSTHATAIWKKESTGETQTGTKTFSAGIGAVTMGFGEHYTNDYVECDFIFFRNFVAVEPAFGAWQDAEAYTVDVNLGYAPLAIKAWGLTSEAIVDVGLGVAELVLNALGISTSRFHVYMGDPRAIGRKPKINVSAGRPSFNPSGSNNPRAQASAASPSFTLAPSKKPRATISMEGD